ncbi:carboxypeptidase-like regulatory domain-containing protein [Streptomyces sp. 4N509B]|uniref:carboxypeptidase-like regulatory domain-containing protein n=1 Tax=Streptomyces sp. 4N509B TaxID=3457413 RepID=UPI003FD12039
MADSLSHGEQWNEEQDTGTVAETTAVETTTAAPDGTAAGGSVAGEAVTGEPAARPAAEVVVDAETEAAALVIRGMVRDALGVALPRAVVTLTGAEGGRRLAKTRSAADGAFTVTAPGRGEFLLAATAPQLGSQSVTVRLTGRPVEVEFRMPVPGHLD